MGSKKKARSKGKKDKAELSIDQQMAQLGLTYHQGNCYLPQDVIEAFVSALEDGSIDAFRTACEAAAGTTPPLQQLMDLHHKLQVEYLESFAQHINESHVVRNRLSEIASRRVHGFQSIAQELITHANIDTTDTMGWTVLHHAVSNSLEDLMHQCIEIGAAIDLLDLRGCSPLFLAVDGDNVEMSSYLLQKGADPNVQSTSAEPNSCLSLACKHGNFEICQLLLAHGADISATLPNGDTALHVASFQGHAEVTKLLCDTRSLDRRQLNAVNDLGQTALFGCPNVAVASILLDYGIDPSIRDQDDETAWSIALALNDLQVANLLAP